MIRSLIESGKIWAVAVVGLLLLNMCICAITVVAATSDPVASAVEPDYYQKAVDWDKSRAEWPEPSKLGWAVTAVDRGAGVVEIETTISITGARAPVLGGTIEARHAGESLEVRTGALTRNSEGRLVWNAGEIGPGLWTIIVRLQGDGGQVMESQRLMIGG